MDVLRGNRAGVHRVLRRLCSLALRDVGPRPAGDEEVPPVRVQTEAASNQVAPLHSSKVNLYENEKLVRTVETRCGIFLLN